MSVAGPSGPSTSSGQLMVSVPANITVAQTINDSGNIHVVGRGFLPNEVVEVWFHSTPQKLGFLTAGPLGTIEGNFVAPAGAPTGVHHIMFVGKQGTQLSSQEITVVAGLARTGSDVTPLWVALLLLLIGTLAIGVGARTRRATHVRVR